MTAAATFALKVHAGQMYGTEPYSQHLSDVTNILESFGFTDSKYQDAGWLHDTVEDTGVLLEDLEKEFGWTTTRIVWACTGIGRNRKERVQCVLDKLKNCPDACIVKCADRIANCMSAEKLDMYRKEQEAFAEVVKPHIPKDMWDMLEKLLAVPEQIKTESL